MLQKFSLAVAGSVVTVGLLGSSAMAAGFSGEYAPSEWTLTNTNTNGFVNTSGVPGSISLTGGNNGGSGFGQTAYTTAAKASGLVSFNWDYTTNDVDGSSFDPFGYILNGTFTQLTSNGLKTPQTGNFSFAVLQGDTFGFAVNTTDNILGAANVVISNFAAPVPEPATVAGLLAIGALGAGAIKRKRQTTNG
ncbi:PEP-CTERM motif family protein [Leptolyngbya sp. 'hensonii']|nr:PEP-CTERM motif family protein [Leptolyngbya sp. 'hensonii']